MKRVTCSQRTFDRAEHEHLAGAGDGKLRLREEREQRAVAAEEEGHVEGRSEPRMEARGAHGNTRGDIHFAPSPHPAELVFQGSPRF